MPLSVRDAFCVTHPGKGDARVQRDPQLWHTEVQEAIKLFSKFEQTRIDKVPHFDVVIERQFNDCVGIFRSIRAERSENLGEIRFRSRLS